MNKFKQFLPICILVVIIFSITGISLFGVSSIKKNDTKEKYSIMSSALYEAVLKEITNPINISCVIANDEFLVGFLEQEKELSEPEAIEKASKYLAGIKKATDAQTAFLVSDNTKRYYSVDGLNKIIDVDKDEHDIWYSIFANTRKPYDLDVDVDQVNGDTWTVFVNARIEDKNGKFLGVCGIGISMEYLQEFMKNYESKYNIKVNFIDSDGLVQVDTDTINIENSYLYDAQYGKEKDGYSYVNSQGKYVVMRYVDDLNWYMVIHGDSGSITIKDVIPKVTGAVVISIMSVIVYLWGIKCRKNDGSE